MATLSVKRSRDGRSARSRGELVIVYPELTVQKKQPLYSRMAVRRKRGIWREAHKHTYAVALRIALEGRRLLGLRWFRRSRWPKS